MKDELDYQALIAEVALIDKEAAEYMQGPMRECFGFCTSGDLWEVVVWEHTAQGTEYWYNIAKQLEKL
jgi:hypothetical protein